MNSSELPKLWNKNSLLGYFVPPHTLPQLISHYIQCIKETEILEHNMNNCFNFNKKISI